MITDKQERALVRTPTSMWVSRVVTSLRNQKLRVRGELGIICLTYTAVATGCHDRGHCCNLGTVFTCGEQFPEKGRRPQVAEYLNTKNCAAVQDDPDVPMCMIFDPEIIWDCCNAWLYKFKQIGWQCYSREKFRSLLET